YGKGRLLVCTLDLEEHVALDPAARRLAGRIMEYAVHAPLSEPVDKVVYIGGAAGAAWLDRIGVTYQPSVSLDASAGLLLIGPDAALDPATLTAYLEKGSKAFFLPRSQAQGWLGTSLKPAASQFAGSLSVPDWPEARGLSASDLRWRSYLDRPPWLLSAGAEIGADGLIGRTVVGQGVALFCQVDPDRFQADEKTYFRYTRWRATRAVAQLLANLGASFAMDSQVFHPGSFAGKLGWSVGPNGDRSGPQATGPQIGPAPGPEGRSASGLRIESETSLSPQTQEPRLPGYYDPDYRTDFPMGDNPYRYYRW
ncbi:MAG: hypothetical protein M1376_05395, partial [Planctomycetes bacterium]|nr:hypothetical protein [Planctomycetota bacterium]